MNAIKYPVKLAHDYSYAGPSAGPIYVIDDDTVLSLVPEALVTDHGGTVHLAAGGRMFYALACYGSHEAATLALRHKLEREQAQLFARLEVARGLLRQLKEDV